MSVREQREWTVGAAAELLGVSVRALHYWHEIGLVVPNGRSSGGYRLYSEQDMERLHHVLLYRETGMSLSHMGEALADPDTGRHLAGQRRMLLARISHLQERVSAVDKLMKETTMGRKISAEERAAILGSGWDPRWEDEAEERWGGTAEWQTTSARVAEMTAADWTAAKVDVDALDEALAEACRTGIEPGEDRANELAEAHLRWLNQWMEAGHSNQVILARMYTDDPRFRAHYDDRAPGLAQWLRQVIEENARGHGVDPDSATWS